MAINPQLSYQFIQDYRLEFFALSQNEQTLSHEQQSVVQEVFKNLSGINYSQPISSPQGLLSFIPRMIEKIIFYTSKTIYYKLYPSHAIEILSQVVHDCAKRRFEDYFKEQKAFIEQKTKAVHSRLGLTNQDNVYDFNEIEEEVTKKEASKKFLISKADLQQSIQEALAAYYKSKIKVLNQTTATHERIELLFKQADTLQKVIYTGSKVLLQAKRLLKIQTELTALNNEKKEKEILLQIQDRVLEQLYLSESDIACFQQTLLKEEFDNHLEQLKTACAQEKGIDLAKRVAQSVEYRASKKEFILSKQEIEALFKQQEAKLFKQKVASENQFLQIKLQCLQEDLEQNQRDGKELEKIVQEKLSNCLCKIKTAIEKLESVKQSTWSSWAFSWTLDPQTFFDYSEASAVFSDSINEIDAKFCDMTEQLAVLTREFQSHYPSISFNFIQVELEKTKRLYDSQRNRLTAKDNYKKRVENQINLLNETIENNQRLLNQTSETFIPVFVRPTPKIKPIDELEERKRIFQNPLLYKKAFFQSLLRTDASYRNLLTPLIKMAAFTFSSSREEGNRLNYKWIQQLRKIAQLWKDAHSDTAPNDSLFDFSIEEAEFKVKRGYEKLYQFSQQGIKLEEVIKQFLEQEVPTNLGIDYTKLMDLESHFNSTSVLKFDSFLTSHSPLHLWSPSLQFFIFSAFHKFNSYLLEIKSSFQKRELEKQKISVKLAKLSHPVVKTLLNALTYTGWGGSLLFSGALKGFRAALPSLLSVDSEIERLKKMHAYYVQCKQTEKAANIEQAIEFAKGAKRLDFNEELSKTEHLFLLDMLDYILLKHSKSEIDLQKVLQIAPMFKNLLSALDDYILGLENQTDHLEAKKEAALLLFEQMFLESVKSFQQLASAFIHNPHCKQLVANVDKAAEKIRKGKKPPEQDPLLEWLQENVIHILKADL